MPLVSLEHINGTPVFTIPSPHPDFGRVHGSSFDKAGQRWIVLAYPPFGLLAVADLKRVCPTATFTPEALAQTSLLEAVPQRLAERTLPEGFVFATKPFDHQVEALSTILQFPRFALYFDAGTGKTKVLIDLKRCFPGKRMLVITPKVTVQNWVREVETHAKGELKAIAVMGTPEQKLSIISRYKAWDVLVCSYGTARSLGYPRLYPATLKAFKAAQAAGVPLSNSGLETLVRGVRFLSDPERQFELALAWALGMPIAQVCRYAEQESKLSPQWLKDVDYEIIVADESHNLNNISSQQTKASLALSKQAGRRYLMSGTPTLGDPRHLYPQMKFLSPAIIPEDWLKFSDMFLVRAIWNKRIVTGYKNLGILNERVQRVAIRKTKDECLTLPPRSVIDVPVILSAEQKKLYNTLVESLEVNLEEFFSEQSTLSVQNAAVLLNKLAQVTSGFVLDSRKEKGICDTCTHLAKCVDANILPYTPRCSVVQKPPESFLNVLKENPKLDVLSDLLDTILANDTSKIIIWGLYHAELDMISELLDTKKVPHVRVDGSTGGNVQARMDEFNTVPTCKVYLGQVATGVGITLNAATYMIYYALPWSLGHYLQSIDRNYRAGQTQKTIVYRLVADGTVDSFKIVALNEKKDVAATLTNKIACITCDRQTVCLPKGIEVFDAGCKYKRNVTRTIATAEVIQ